jgi:hypothetical protein
MSNTIFPKKYTNALKVEPNFTESANSMKEDELKKLILSCESDINEVEKAKEGDTQLAAAKENVKQYGASYRETKTLLTAKIKYALHILEERGVSLTR